MTCRGVRERPRVVALATVLAWDVGSFRPPLLLRLHVLLRKELSSSVTSLVPSCTLYVTHPVNARYYACLRASRAWMTVLSGFKRSDASSSEGEPCAPCPWWTQHARALAKLLCPEVTSGELDGCTSCVDAGLLPIA